MTADDVFRALQRGEPVPGSHLIVVAHADDESISASRVMSLVEHGVVVQLTSGAFDSPERFGDPAEQCRISRAERTAAYTAAGWRWPVIDVNCPLDRVMDALPAVRARLGALVSAEPFDAVWTHPYEHGHLDHDSAAWLCAWLPTIPLHLEFASYYMGEDKRVRFGSFSPQADRRETVLTLTGAALACKRAALAAYATQAHILRKFLTPEREAYRVAPVYDFLRPAPAPRSRWDERGYQPSCDVWRQVAARAEVA